MGPAYGGGYKDAGLSVGVPCRGGYILVGLSTDIENISPEDVSTFPGYSGGALACSFFPGDVSTGL